MIELELLGANGDTVVMTDANGERYQVVIDDALRAAVRRDRQVPASEPVEQPATTWAQGTARPKDLQALIRAGASAQEVADLTGTDVDHVRRFETPVLAERGWAVEQARTCRIGWEKDSPLLGELVLDRLATREVDPSSLEWDALREGRGPWRVNLTFVEAGQEKQASWVLDLQARSVSAVDEESRWLTEGGPGARRPTVFDQDSPAPGASAHEHAASASYGIAPTTPSRLEDSAPPPPDEQDAGSDTDALLADLASNRGRRVEVEIPDDSEDEDTPAQESLEVPEPSGRAQVFSMQDRRRAFAGNHPAGTRINPEPQESGPEGRSDKSRKSPAAAKSASAHLDAPTAEVAEVATQDALPDMPAEPEAKPRRRPRRSVPSWDEIVFGAKPE